MLDPVIEQTDGRRRHDRREGFGGLLRRTRRSGSPSSSATTRGWTSKFLPEMIRRHPRLPQMWRFFIDTWSPTTVLPAQRRHRLVRRRATELRRRLRSRRPRRRHRRPHERRRSRRRCTRSSGSSTGATKDPAFAQVVSTQNEGKLDGLPYDLFSEDPDAMQRELKRVIDEHGARDQAAERQQAAVAPRRAALRHAASTAAPCGSTTTPGGSHGHADGMNLGLVRQGARPHARLRLPARAVRRVGFAARELVQVRPGRTTPSSSTAPSSRTAAPGTTTLWAAGRRASLQAIAAVRAGAQRRRHEQFERTVALIDVADDDAYVLDVFRVAGGSDHAKFFIEPLRRAHADRPASRIAARDRLRPPADAQLPQGDAKPRRLVGRAGRSRTATSCSSPSRPDVQRPLHRLHHRRRRLHRAKAGSSPAATTRRRRHVGPARDDAAARPRRGTPISPPRSSPSSNPSAPASAPIKSARRLPSATASDATSPWRWNSPTAARDLVVSTDVAGDIALADEQLTTDARFVRRPPRRRRASRSMIALCQGTSACEQDAVAGAVRAGRLAPTPPRARRRRAVVIAGEQSFAITLGAAEAVTTESLAPRPRYSRGVAGACGVEMPRSSRHSATSFALPYRINLDLRPDLGATPSRCSNA